MEVSLNVTFSSWATGQEYFQVVPLSSEIIRWVECFRGLSRSLEATTQKSLPSFPSHMAPRLYAGIGSPKRPKFNSTGQGDGIIGVPQVCPPSLVRSTYPPIK